MKKKVLLVITKSNWGGAQRYVYNLATSLPKEDFDVSVGLGGTGFSGSDAGELAQKLQAANIPVHFIHSFLRDVSLLSDLRAFFELLSLYRRERPDVVHLNSSKAGGVGALAARVSGVKNIIFTSHGLVWDEDRGKIATLLIYAFSRFTFALSHKVIVISKDNFARTQTFFSKKKYTLIHNGLPALQFETPERARVSLALKVGLVEDGNTFWIGTIAELTRNKGLSYLLDAMRILIDSGRKFHLFVIGGGEEELSLKKLVHEHDLQDSVHMVGFVSDAYRYNKAFNIFTLTSVKEGLPTVLLEAGQAGVTVVASNIPGSLDIIENGKTGILFASKNSQDLAEKISHLMDDTDTRAQLAHGLYQKVTNEFSIERMVSETKELYTLP